MLPFTPEELEAAVRDGLVTKRPHPSLPYFIYNYTPETQYSKRWNEITLNCRGLILDDNYNIVARPWKKFFNLGEVELPIQFDDPVEIMDKADGSLGILYVHEDDSLISNLQGSIATRGSFISEQAKHATALFRDKYESHELLKNVNMSGMTYLFEIVYPENRIVLDYGSMDDLILLGAVQKSTGYYYGPRDAQAFIGWSGPVIEVFNHNNISEALGDMARKNAEGYVIRSHNFMVKLKQPDYLELHRLVTNASPRTVWEQLSAGKSKSQIISAFPDEFHSYIEGMIEPLLETYDRRVSEIMDGYSNTVESLLSYGDSFDRGRYARSIAKAADKRYYFLLLDNKSIRDTLWAELKPKGTDTVRNEND